MDSRRKCCKHLPDLQKLDHFVQSLSRIIYKNGPAFCWLSRLSRCFSIHNKYVLNNNCPWLDSNLWRRQSMVCQLCHSPQPKFTKLLVNLKLLVLSYIKIITVSYIFKFFEFCFKNSFSKKILWHHSWSYSLAII